MTRKTQKIRVLYPMGDEKRYMGSTATEIVTALWQGHVDFTKSKNVDEWMKHTFFPDDAHPKGRTTEERCEDYLKKFKKAGYGILVTKGSSLDKKLNHLRLNPIKIECEGNP